MTLSGFFKTAVKNLRSVGAIAPTSRWAIGLLLNQINPPVKCLLEYGAGGGAITRELLSRLAADGRLIAVELVDEFVSELRRLNDSRLTVVHDDIFRVLPSLADVSPEVVVSGIPLSYQSREERERLVAETWRLLKTGGMFLVYQTTPLVFPLLRRHFRRVELLFEPRNLPPCFIMAARK